MGLGMCGRTDRSVTPKTYRTTVFSLFIILFVNYESRKRELKEKTCIQGFNFIWGSRELHELSGETS